MVAALRQFGRACDWAPAAAEALVAGPTGTLAPVGQALSPTFYARHLLGAALPEYPNRPLPLTLLSPMDDAGANAKKQVGPAARLLSRGIRRWTPIARWQGLALSDEVHRFLTEAAHVVTALNVRLKAGRRDSPNRHRQERMTQVVSGEIDLPALPDDNRLLLSLGRRCRLGRQRTRGWASSAFPEHLPQSRIRVAGLRPCAGLRSSRRTRREGKAGQNFHDHVLSHRPGLSRLRRSLGPASSQGPALWGRGRPLSQTHHGSARRCLRRPRPIAAPLWQRCAKWSNRPLPPPVCPPSPPHSFRKTLGILANDHCRTPEQDKTWPLNLGHENIATTLSTYTPVSAARQAQLIREMG